MSLPGGVADKLGGQYESRWTVRCALRVLAGRSDWIEVEPVGPAGEGIEFLLADGAQIEQHQVKRALTGRGHWTLTALRDAGVLGHFKRLVEQGGNPRFVSGQDADVLHVLSDRARGSRDLNEFRANWLGEGWTEKFRDLVAVWAHTEAEAYDALQRCHVTVADGDVLDDWNLSVVERYVDGEPAGALTDLAEVLVRNMQQRLDTAKLWKELETPFGRRQRRWADATVGVQVRERTRDYLAPLRAVRLRHPIVRDEAGRALGLLRDGPGRGVLLAGAAGAGKSDVILQILDEVEALGWPTLALRVDRLSEVHSPEGLGEQLGLPTSPAPVLGAVAVDGPSLLVVDQLDAVSLASGRLRRLWEPVSALLRQAQAQPGMRVLLACRQFDLDNDHRLRTLVAPEGGIAPVPVAPLTDSKIDRALGAMGADIAGLGEAQRRVLELPLHLTLLEPLVAAGARLTFTTVTELFEAFWQHKRETVDERREGVAFGPTLKFLSDAMSERRALSVPALALEATGYDRDAMVLASEYLVVRDGTSYAFFHESFFDFTFARFFIAEGKGASDLLAGDEQDLFRRAQVRQVLALERDRDRPAYLRDLHELIYGDGVRFHIRQVLLALLRALPDPSSDELERLRPILEGDPDDRRFALTWHAICTPAWFAVANDMGHDTTWLAGDEHRRNAVTRVLAAAGDSHPARVAALLTEASDGSPTWLDRIGYVLRMCDVANHRALFDLLLGLARARPLERSDRDIWLDGHGLPATEPGWAAELLVVLLERAQERAVTDGHCHAFEGDAPLDREHGAQKYVEELGRAAPAELVEAALPWLLSVAQADVDANGSMIAGDERLAVDRTWGLRYTGERHRLRDVLLGALADALTAVAAEDPERFESWADWLQASRLDVAQFLLYKGLQGDPERHAERAGRLLLEGGARWQCGYADDGRWVTRELLAAVSPHLDGATFQAIERAIMDWTPAYERRAEARSLRGVAQRTLLSGLDRSRLSEAGARRLGELGRKLGGEEPEAPLGIQVGEVVSPISFDAGRRMDDEQWLAAIAKHRASWNDRAAFGMVGGAEELAGMVQTLAGEDPGRWARLGLRLPDDTLPIYFEYLLIGLGQPQAGAELAPAAEAFALVRDVAARPGRPAERWLPWLVERYADQPVPSDVVAIVAAVATDAQDPDRELWRTEARQGQPYYGGSAWEAGMNSARGAAAETIARLLAADEARVEILEPAVRELAADASVAVRACAAETIGAYMRWRREEAVALIDVLLDTDDAIFSARPVAELLRAATVTHSPRVAPFVERMLSSQREDARQGGARLACLAALLEHDAAPLLDRCLKHDDVAVRAGAAQVLAANLDSARFTARCADGLATLFCDESPQVREQAVKAFWHMQGSEIAAHVELVRALLASPAYEQGRGDLLLALESSTGRIAEIVLMVADRMLVSDGASIGDVREASGGDAKDLTELLIRVLGESEDDVDARGRALDALDGLTAAGAWGVVEAMDAVDR